MTGYKLAENADPLTYAGVAGVLLTQAGYLSKTETAAIAGGLMVFVVLLMGKYWYQSLSGDKQ